MIEIAQLDAFHGDFRALSGVGMQVRVGETVALIGANGAGKTTLLRCIAGLVRRKSGNIVYKGRDILGTRAEEICRAGIALVPEGRLLFPSLDVEENLKMGAVSGRRGRWGLNEIYDLFPILAERRRQPATQLSGGQQQMVAIGRALMMNPHLLLCDEISLGLAPAVIDQIYRALEEVRSDGLAILLVEQDITRARSVSQRLYCLLEGQVTLSGRSATLNLNDISKAYFGG